MSVPVCLTFKFEWTCCIFISEIQQMQLRTLDSKCTHILLVPVAHPLWGPSLRRPSALLQSLAGPLLKEAESESGGAAPGWSRFRPCRVAPSLGISRNPVKLDTPVCKVRRGPQGLAVGDRGFPLATQAPPQRALYCLATPCASAPAALKAALLTTS